ncbi:hypothetical protein E3N88_26843 [Mikania micrantha]|uniref:Uncharacterized protein n=1 Tax=Mikania micrantha TaxID=192012 RepID=A0A5N6MXY6_9ASTR|nr:hypothetical protein E3N88_26843 [Mikania micrantha]
MEGGVIKDEVGVVVFGVGLFNGASVMSWRSSGGGAWGRRCGIGVVVWRRGGGEEVEGVAGVESRVKQMGGLRLWEPREVRENMFNEMDMSGGIDAVCERV